MTCRRPGAEVASCAGPEDPAIPRWLIFTSVPLRAPRCRAPFAMSRQEPAARIHGKKILSVKPSLCADKRAKGLVV
jgi:hypothetical protein